MNPIQKAWLVALKPVISLVNDKLAKKSGILGRIGKFYAFGPRQFGYHPINRIIALFNQNLIEFFGFVLHKYPVLRSLTQNGYYHSRPNVFLSLIGPFSLFVSILLLTFPYDYQNEDGTSLSHLRDKGINTPYNALNMRKSAHFTQINEMYFTEMAKRYFAKSEQIATKRNGCNEKTKKTRFARQGYEYIEAHSKAQ